MNDLLTDARRATPVGQRTARTVRKGLALGAMAAVLGCEGPGPTEVVDVGPLIEAPAAQAVGGQMAGARMLLYAYDGADRGPLVAGLVATGLFAATDIEFQLMTDPPPEVETFLGYDCAVVWTNSPPPSPVAQGDVLKDYADAGGRVILATFAYASSSIYRLQGGIMASGYSPLVSTDVTLTAFPRSLDFPTALTDHELLEGVADFSYGGFGRNEAEVTLDPGALLVGSDNFGVPLIGMSASQRVVGVNAYPLKGTSPGFFRTFANACTGESAVEVTVDVKPGNDSNPVNPMSQGRLPVAILGSLELDVADVDPTSLTFGPDGAPPVHDLTVAATYADHLQDVDGDGLTDLVSHYQLAETGIGPGDDEGCLAGSLTDGTSIEGCDAVRVLDAGPSPNGLGGGRR